MDSASVFAFEVRVKDTDWSRVVNARTPGKAKLAYYRDLLDAWPDISFTALRCRKLGEPLTTESFKRNAAYRGLPDVRCGDRVTFNCGARGVIVGHNSSANFDVLFDEDSPRYPGLTLNVHPSEVVLEKGGAHRG